MLSHTEDFTLDYRGKCRSLVQPSLQVQSTAALYEHPPPKRITENPSLIHWSIHMTSAMLKTSHRKDTSS